MLVFFPFSSIIFSSIWLAGKLSVHCYTYPCPPRPAPPATEASPATVCGCDEQLLPANQSADSLPSPAGVAVYAAVGRVRDPQPGRLHALLSERTDGQVHAHLPGRQQYSAGVASCLVLQCPSSQMDAELCVCLCICVRAPCR